MIANISVGFCSHVDVARPVAERELDVKQRMALFQNTTLSNEQALSMPRRGDQV